MLRRRVSVELLVALVVSAAAHAAWFIGEAEASSEPTETAFQTTEVTLEDPPEPEPKPAPEAEPETAPSANPTPEKMHDPTRSAGPSAPPAAAQAGLTLTAPDSDATADFTMVQGAGTAYVGGVTAPNGTSTSAVRGQPTRGGAGTGATEGHGSNAPTAAPRGPDRSRPARPSSTNWNCSHLFPSDHTAGNRAVVTLVVTVRPNGSVTAIRVLSDPGHGFGAAARRCARTQSYRAALDRGGRPTTAITPPITVRFSR